MPEPIGHLCGPRTPLIDHVHAETVAILTRLSRAPIVPQPDHELMADLGFDSLLVMELIGELEEHFEIAVPLNDLTHIRTVEQIVDQVTRLVAVRDARP